MSDISDYLMRAFVAIIIAIAFMLWMEGCATVEVARHALHDGVIR